MDDREKGTAMITLVHPIWLALAIPLAASWLLWRHSSRFLRFTRLALLLLILLALCGLAVKLPSRNGTIVVVADRSLSMPQGAEAAQKEAIDLIGRAMTSDDRLAVVSFGQSAAIERSPQTGAFGGFTNEVGRDASNLAEAIDKALAIMPQSSPGKILVISDGRWTGKDPAVAASRAATRGVAIDYRSLQRSSANDLAIAQIDAPVTVTPGEAFMITAWVKSPLQQEIAYELRRGGQVLAAGKTNAGAGLSRLTFRDLAGEPGAQGYTIRVSSAQNGAGDDPVPENNSAKVLIGVRGPRPLLLVSSSPNSGLARLLSAGGMKIKLAAPEDCDWTLDSLAQYSGVLIENVPAEKITNRGMESIVSWVSEAGAGLMMSGGKHAYGPGGYFKSPLEPALPVSMELRQEHRKLAMAIVVAMDRSGSMAVSVGGGRTKMDLANLAAAQVLDMLTPVDEFGVVAVDSASHIIADLRKVDDPGSVRNRILKIDSGGGGIFIFEALTTAADMLLKAQSGTRHIVLFADAADSEEPGKYRELLQQCEQSGITVSVIGLGKPTDGDAELLRDIARRGGGQIFFTENAEDLPRLFAQDTIIVARSMFLDQPAQIQFTGGMITLTGKQFTGLQSIGGYNLTYLRPKANLAAVTTDEYKAPVVASWQAGGGRVLCYLGEADGQYAGAVAGWKDAGDFFTSLARWVAGDAGDLPGGMLLTQDVKNGVARIELHLDPERDEVAALSPSDPPKVTTLRGVAGSKPSSEKAEMRWASADTLEIEIPLRGNETALSTVEVPGAGRVTLSPVALPYSPEFKPVSGEEGRAALAHLALATGGKERVEISGAWKDLPRLPRLVELAPWLLMLATVLLLIEVLERHTSLISARLAPELKRGRERIREVMPAKLRWPRKKRPVETAKRAPSQPVADQQAEPEMKPAEPAVAPAAILDALRQARQQAKERTKR
ncbi:MAG TPA: VWA domain-containing protein [Blastocatellia bacterium]|jgi:Mg-chelatase subunit ChlD|nr:VWA domain-containing protein [Blastocatellia bacterium]